MFLATFDVGSRRIDKALDYASQLTVNARQLLPKIVVLLTAGRQASGQPLELAAKPLLDHGAKIYVVAIGDRPDENELLLISKDKTSVIKISSFNDLPGRALIVAQKLGNQSGERVSKIITFDLCKVIYFAFKSCCKPSMSVLFLLGLNLKKSQSLRC